MYTHRNVFERPFGSKSIEENAKYNLISISLNKIWKTILRVVHGHAAPRFVTLEKSVKGTSIFHSFCESLYNRTVGKQSSVVFLFVLLYFLRLAQFTLFVYESLTSDQSERSGVMGGQLMASPS